ncbi:DUF2490 domain-containing protein [Pelobium sp.]|nr:DUF2490 domain-containing protein [Pelobium sp.]MDA9554883.1 DUF2490 domain-containing protein [Pelobium sp.]
MKKLTLLFFSIFASFTTMAQISQQNAAWLLWQHSQKTSTKTSFNLDLLLRSNNDFNDLRNFLIRPSFSYQLAKNLTSTAGYLYSNTKTYASGNQKSHLSENMIFEQLGLTYKVKSVNSILRLRLEQRFIEQQTANIFSQRARLLSRFVIPLAKRDSSSFDKGNYFSLQDEVFFNIQNKEKLNAHFYDQNRFLVGLGHKFNPQLDLELAYMGQSIKRNYTTIYNNIIQLSVRTQLNHHKN